MTFEGAYIDQPERLDQVLGTVMTAVGLIDTDPTPLSPSVPRAERACIVLVDGLGFEQLQQRRGHAPTLRSLGIDRHISTVVPSTTAAGITAFGTGRRPGATAMVGYSLRAPRSGRTFSLIAWDDDTVSAQTWQTEPTLFEGLGERAEQTSLIQPAKFVGSGLTTAALRGAPSVVAQSLPQRVDAAVAQLRAGDKLTYLYWGDLDSAGHKEGWLSERWTGELETFDAEFGRLLCSLPAGTLVVLTADHGMIDVTERIDIADRRELTQGVDAVAGESRAVHLYTGEPEAVASRWSEYFGDTAWVATADEVIAAGLLGPTSEFTREVMGDVLAFARGSAVIVDSRVQSSTAIGLIGVHGSLTRQEMAIPFVVEVV